MNTYIRKKKQDDEGYIPSDAICDLLGGWVVSTYVESIKRDRRRMLVPFRVFQAPYRVRAHISNYHVGSNIWCASGRKQLRVRITLYDNDSFAVPPWRSIHADA